MKKPKPKPRRLPAPGGGRAIGNIACFIIASSTPTPEFLKHLIVKKGD